MPRHTVVCDCDGDLLLSHGAAYRLGFRVRGRVRLHKRVLGVRDAWAWYVDKQKRGASTVGGSGWELFLQAVLAALPSPDSDMQLNSGEPASSNLGV